MIGVIKKKCFITKNDMFKKKKGRVLTGFEKGKHQAGIRIDEVIRNLGRLCRCKGAE